MSRDYFDENRRWNSERYKAIYPVCEDVTTKWLLGRVVPKSKVECGGDFLTFPKIWRREQSERDFSRFAILAVSRDVYQFQPWSYNDLKKFQCRLNVSSILNAYLRKNTLTLPHRVLEC